MTQTSNIEKFDEFSGQVLASFYNSFPVPINLQARDFVEQPTQYDESSQCDRASPDAVFFIATVEWLRRAGYIHADEQDGNDRIVKNGVLTAKGLEVLKIKPTSLTDEPSLGDQLADAAKKGSSDAVRKAVTEIMSLGARLMLQTLN
ncbi:hypothetical protein SAMN04487867_10836 [Vreelandella titanicae]|uniref:hypothetical protein n=1 Tax=Vreelandella titanicae TaxID=664683 RepID=UPI00088CF357|nr:hypothetical protein [Halomonas titanicae]SDI51354.1 hypothetical protein SAMN04487867_10836 [Halomonas titanicae]